MTNVFYENVVRYNNEDVCDDFSLLPCHSLCSE